MSPGKKRQTAAKSAVQGNFILIYCYSYNKILIKKNQLYLTVINHFTPKSAGSKFEKKSLNFNMQNQQKQRVKHESAA